MPKKLNNFNILGSGEINRNHQLKITVLNAIFFFPFIFLWLPALWFNLKNPRNDSKVKKAKILNFTCLVTGNF